MYGYYYIQRFSKGKDLQLRVISDELWLSIYQGSSHKLRHKIKSLLTEAMDVEFYNKKGLITNYCVAFQDFLC